MESSIAFVLCFRPAKYVDTFLQKPRLLWDFAERHDLFRDYAGAHTARLVRRPYYRPRLPLAAVFSPSASAHWRTHSSNPLIRDRKSSRFDDCDQDVMDSLLVDVGIVAEPPDSAPLFRIHAFIKSHQCVRVFWVHRQTPETLPVPKIRNYLPGPTAICFAWAFLHFSSSRCPSKCWL